MCNGATHLKSGSSYLDIIIKFGYEKIFETLRKEAFTNEMNKYKRIKNE